MEAVASPEMLPTATRTIQGSSNCYGHCSTNPKSETAVWDDLDWIFFLFFISHIRLTNSFKIQSSLYKSTHMGCMHNWLSSLFFWDSAFSYLQDFVSFLYSKHTTWLYMWWAQTEGVWEQGAEQNIWTQGAEKGRIMGGRTPQRTLLEWA
jgi:hypothetical protein